MWHCSFRKENVPVTRKVTMEDLAREAGCSRPQVSRTFNGKANVAPEVRARILNAAARLNYRNTANRHQVRIAVIAQGIGGIYSQRMLDALINESAGRNWICQIIPETSLKSVSPYFYDGVVSLIYNQAWARTWVEERSIPLVMVNSYGTVFDRICSVDPDPLQESRIVLRHLKKLGHRKIARVHFVSEMQTTYRRGEKEFLQAAAQLNLGDSVRNFQLSSPQEMERWETFRSILSEKFTAVYMIHQSLAVHAAKFIQEAGYRIPEDCSLVTYELPGISEYLTPPHTTVDFDYETIAKRALEELRLRMLGKGEEGGSIRIPNILKIRSSTGPCRR